MSLSSNVKTLQTGEARLEKWLSLHADWLAVGVLLLGLAIRFWVASLTYFNLDEAHHSRLAVPGFPELWRRALGPAHPPLLIVLLHYVRMISLSEIALRTIPVLAGGLFPWFLYRWLGLVRGKAAGLIALTIATFTPNVMSLSTEVRAYTLVLFFIAATLYCLERAIGDRSTKWMCWFTGVLLLAILSEYSAAFVCAAAGVYVLIRLPDLWPSPKVIAVWVVSQLLALGLYVYLYFAQVIRSMGNYQTLFNQPSWLLERIPREGEGAVEFFWRGTLGVFEFVFSSAQFSAMALAVFLFGLVVLLLSASSPFRRRIAWLVLLMAPFALACAAAVWGYHPYGSTRQLLFLAGHISIGMAIALDWLFRRRIWTAALGMVVYLWLLNGYAGYKPLQLDPVQRPEVLHAALDYLRDNLEPGSLIVTENDTRLILEVYIEGDKWPPTNYPNGIRGVGGYKVFCRRGRLQTLEEVAEDLAEWRSLEEIDPDTPVWVIDSAGISDLYHLLEANPELRNQLTDVRTFGEAVTIIQVPAGYAGPQAAAP